MRITVNNALLFALLSLGCSVGLSAPTASEKLALEVARALADACPVAAADSLPARDACAQALAQMALLKDSMRTPFFWGAQRLDAGYDYAAAVKTVFNPLVFRKMYLSTFMFPGGATVIQAGAGLVIARIPVKFRGAMDSGSYPYPFWHSLRKWTSYSCTQNLLLYVQDGKVIGGLRAADEPEACTPDNRAWTWDGRWTWDGGAGKEEPRNTLYSFLFSANNPHVAKLEQAYRDLELRLRSQNCLTCHSPDNAYEMNPLELLSYPNQALSGRHGLVSQLEANLMPPPEGDAGRGLQSEQARQELLALSKTFARAGDEALAFEDALVAP